jgi:uncharacterized protein YcfJ
MRSTLKAMILAPALLIAAACGKDKAADPSLNNDLSLAAQANPNARLDSISAAERMNAGVAPATALRSGTSVPATTRRTTASAPARRTTTSSGTRRGTTVASEPRTVTKKNTKRDAAIGAAAGAVIGGATHGVKGGIIGAAAGGILGGVIGNNVDIQKKRVP